VERCRVPVIAALSGFVIGAGVDLSSACDIRICSKDAKFSIKEIDIGMCADLGTIQRFQKVIGNDSFFRELAYTGRFFDA
jgi:enoyl-CoA hydratase/carnithine racemase